MKESRVEQRQSGIELLKIIAMLLIVLNHVVQSLHQPDLPISYHDYQLPVGIASNYFPYFVLNVLRYSGGLGNNLFFITSAWFLVDRRVPEGRKIAKIILNVWAVSVVSCGVMLVVRGGDIPIGMVLRQFMPNILGNNWYITCYILFLMIYPYLNTVIASMTQRQMLRATCIGVVLWCCITLIFGAGLLFASALINWVVIYLLVAYMKRYMPEFQRNQKANVIVLSVGLVGLVGMIAFTNTLGLRIDFFSTRVLRWDHEINPFELMFGLAALNLFSGMKLQSRMVNVFSGLGMFVYLLHDNLLFRSYCRPAIWQQLYLTFGYEHILVLVGLYSVGLYLASAGIAAVYKLTLEKPVNQMAERLYFRISEAWGSLEDQLIQWR